MVSASLAEVIVGAPEYLTHGICRVGSVHCVCLVLRDIQQGISEFNRLVVGVRGATVREIRHGIRIRCRIHSDGQALRFLNSRHIASSLAHCLFALLREGSRIAIRIAMMATTTSNSIRVNADLRLIEGFLSKVDRRAHTRMLSIAPVISSRKSPGRVSRSVNSRTAARLRTQLCISANDQGVQSRQRNRAESGTRAVQSKKWNLLPVRSGQSNRQPLVSKRKSREMLAILRNALLLAGGGADMCSSGELRTGKQGQAMLQPYKYVRPRFRFPAIFEA